MPSAFIDHDRYDQLLFDDCLSYYLMIVSVII